jgi:hypothetical protein
MKATKDNKLRAKARLGALTAGLLMASSAMAQITHIQQPILDDTRLILAGTGCSDADAVSQIETVRGIVLTINFGHFHLMSTGRMNCTMRIPITIPAGYRVIVSEGSPNGFADLAFDDTLSVSSRLSVLGQFSAIHNQVLHGPAQEDFGPSFDLNAPPSVFRSQRRVSSGCALHDQRGLLGLNIAANLSSSTGISSASLTDAQIGVRLVPCR